MALANILHEIVSPFINLYLFGRQLGIISGANQAIDYYLSSPAKLKHPELINADLENLVQSADPRTYEKITARLRTIGEGYSLLKKNGSEDPLQDLGVSPEDYIGMKLDSIRKIMEISGPLNSVLFHLAEASEIAKGYKVGSDEHAKIQAVCSEIFQWSDSNDQPFAVYDDRKWHIWNLIALSNTGNLNPNKFIRYPGSANN